MCSALGQSAGTASSPCSPCPKGVAPAHTCPRASHTAVGGTASGRARRTGAGKRLAALIMSENMDLDEVRAARPNVRVSLLSSPLEGRC